ncbi:MAG TPA: hypothetical protein VEB86_00810 [Chryseosolibacter sp.]|nr:hypothetical protein [Chryseosolibacter sp.]
MKKSILFVLALSAHLGAGAQEAGYQPGAIITLTNERIEGLVKNVNLAPARILVDIKFKKSEGEKVTVYSPDELLGYESQGSTYVPKTTSMGNKIFVKKLITGKLSLYGELAFDGSDSYNVTHVYYIQLDTDPVLRDVPQISFRSQMLKYLKNAPGLCNLISDKTLKWKDLPKIVAMYNEEVQVPN